MMNNYKLTQDEINILEKQLLKQYCDNYNIDYNQDITPEFQNNKHKNTFAMWLTEEQYLIPRKWMHNYDIKNEYGKILKTFMESEYMPMPQHWKENEQLTIFDQAIFKQIPDMKEHKPDEQNEDGFTVAMICANYGQKLPEYLQHDPTIQNKYGMTVAMYQARSGRIPDKYWYHDPTIHDEYGYTVAMFLIQNKIVPPKEWCYDTFKYMDDYYNQIYHLFGNYNVIPPRYLIDMVEDKQRFIYKFQEAYQYIPIPSQQQETNPTIFDIAMLEQIPDITNHKPEEQDENGWTVAMILAFQGIQPPRQWMHSYDIKNNFNKSLKYYLKESKLLIPLHYKDEDIDLIDKVIFDIPISKEEYNPEYQNKYGYTVAMIQVLQGNIPDKQWQHNKYLRYRTEDVYDWFNNRFAYVYYYTIQNLLEKQNISVPKEWKYTPLNKNEDNQAIIDARNGIIPQLSDNDPEYQNINGNTVGILLANQGILPPKEWMHNVYLENSWHQSIKSSLESKHIPVPYHWKDNDMNQFDQACYKIIPQLNTHNPNEQNEDGWTVAMILAFYKIEVPEYWYHKPELQNKYRQTIFDIYIDNNIMSLQWCFQNPDYQDDDGNTQAIKLILNKFDIPKQLYHDPKIQNNRGYTIAMLLAQRKFEIQQQWYHDPQLQNNNGQTVAFIQVLHNKIPDKQWIHNKYLRFRYKNKYYTIQDILQRKNKNVPDEWKYNYEDEKENTQAILQAKNQIYPDEQYYHHPLQSNLDGQTVAIVQSYKEVIPQRQWMHDINIKTKQGQSIYSLLSEATIPIPYHWHDEDMTIFDKTIFGDIPELGYHDPSDQNEDGWTIAMILEFQGKQIPKCWEHNPNIQNRYGQTVALLQAKNGKIPEKQWIHDKFLRCYHRYLYCTVQNFIQDDDIEIPEEWKYDPLDDDEANQAINDTDKGIIPQLQDNDPNYQDISGDTVANILIDQNIVPPKQWVPKITKENVYNESIRQCLYDLHIPIQYHWNDKMTIFDKACCGQIPQLANHKPEECNEDCQTIAMILAQLKIDIPKEWYHDPRLQDKNGNTVAMFLASKGIIPSKQWQHKPQLQNKQLKTVAMYLAQNKIEADDQWYHDPCLTDINNYTVAMILAQNQTIASQKWHHDTLKENNDEYTVAMILGSQYIVPPEIWMHRARYPRFRRTLLQVMDENGYCYSSALETYVPNYKTEIKNKICQVCFQDGQQEFLVTKCGHDVCFDCFKQILKESKEKCPICRKEFWYYQLIYYTYDDLHETYNNRVY